jgi:hypothetical protein
LRSITIILFTLLTLFSGEYSCQSDSLTDMIRIDGKVRDENDQPIANAIIINKNTKSGSFGRADGSFLIVCNRQDTLAITSLGFMTRSLTYADSSGTSFTPVIYLETRVYQMAAVEIFAPRELEQIQEDIDKLGYNEEDYMLSGINAAQSPITFLYQQFSKKERSKREVARMENEDRKRELLKELFRLYVDYQIIELNDDDFDAFIDYLNVSDEFMIRSTQYDFLIYVRDRFRDYKVQLRQRKRLDGSDFDYDKD